ncbi:hypothetical protein GGX14DRAFT_352272, partial [Mycena pura]
TYYTPGEMNATACGPKHQDSDPIAALAHDFFDNYPGATADPNNNPLCGRQIIITATGRSGEQVTAPATIADRCGDCNITTSVDVTGVIFDQFADTSVGRLYNISWDWADAASSSGSVSAPPAATGTTSPLPPTA